MRLQKPGSIVLVEWFDAESIDAWGSLVERIAQHKEWAPVKTVGIVLDHTEKSIILARSYNENDHTLEGSFMVPAGLIKSIKKFTYAGLDISSESQ